MIKTLKTHGALLLVTLLYSGNYTIAKIAMPEYIKPFGFIVIRVVSGSILFWALGYFTIKGKAIKRGDLGLLVLCGFFGVAANQLLFFKGLSLTSPINASIIMTFSPVIVMLTAYLLGRETLSIRKVLGVIIAGTGTYLLLTKDGASFKNQGFVGDLFVLLNATSYAIYLVLVKRLMEKYNTITVIKWIFLVGIVMVVPFGYGEFMAIDFKHLPVSIWLAVLYVVIGTSFLAYLLNGWALKSVNSSVVGTYMYLQPVFAALIAIWIRKDVLQWQVVLFSLLIMGGVFLVSKKQGQN